MQTRSSESLAGLRLLQEVRFHQGDCPIVVALGLGCKPAARADHVAEEVEGLGQAVTEKGHEGWSCRQFLEDRHRRTALGLRLGPACPSETAGWPSSSCGTRPNPAVNGDGGLVFHQFLIDRQPAAVLGLRLRRLAHRGEQAHNG